MKLENCISHLLHDRARLHEKAKHEGWGVAWLQTQRMGLCFTDSGMREGKRGEWATTEPGQRVSWVQQGTVNSNSMCCRWRISLLFVNDVTGNYVQPCFRSTSSQKWINYKKGTKGSAISCKIWQSLFLTKEQWNPKWQVVAKQNIIDSGLQLITFSIVGH